MGWSSPFGPARSRSALALAALAAALLSAPAAADTIVSGRATDASTGAPVAGVTVKIRREEQVLGEAVSGADGLFQVSFRPSGTQAQNFQLDAEHADYVPPPSRLFVVAAGRPDQASFTLDLLPRALARCQQKAERTILVGQFSGDGGGDLQSLSTRMSEALTYSLVVQLQRLKIRPELQPLFAACWEAAPRSPELAGQCARAVKADALVFGRVTRAENRFDVKTFVGDGYGLFSPPIAFHNRKVDLAEPDEAVLDARTHAAILAVMGAAYERQGKYGECVEAATAAERMARELGPVLRALRERCQKASGTGALTRGGQP